jgi:hypothetical protein
MTIQRYQLNHYTCRAFNSDIMEKSTDGKYVLYTDNLAALAEKESLAHDRGVIIDSQLEQIAALTAVIETQGREHKEPCNLGPLCPWCKIAALQAQIDSDRGLQDKCAALQARIEKLTEALEKIRSGRGVGLWATEIAQAVLTAQKEG